MGTKGQNSTFSEHGHVEYQIQGNHECSSMVANILLVDPYHPQSPPYDPVLGMGSIGQNSTFSEHGHVAYEIIGNHKMQEHGSKHFASRPLPLPIPTTLGKGK